MKIGIDGGSSFLKICLSGAYMDRPESHSPTKPPGRKKLNMDQKFLYTGVKKILVIGLVADVPESYDNIKCLLSSLNLTQISFTIACDLKLANVLAGLQGHSSMHPCLYCEGKAPWVKVAQARTLGNIKENTANFERHGKNMAREWSSTFSLELRTRSLMSSLLYGKPILLTNGHINIILCD